MGSPSVVVTYGASKRGKSTDFLYSCPNALFLVPAKGNLDSWAVLTGVAPLEIVVPTFSAAIGVLRDVKEGRTPRPPVVVLDDLSILAERTLIALDPTGNGGWKTWTVLRRQLLAIRELCLDLGVSMWANGHIQPPEKDDDGNLLLGGPKLPSKGMSADLPHIAQLVLRLGHEPFTEPPGWPGRYICDPSDTRWIVGDRYCVVPKAAPMNLREILIRAAQVRKDDDRPTIPPRAPGLEWLDAAAETVCRGIASGATPSLAREALVAAAAAGKLPSKSPHLLRWAWRDGCDRHTLRSAGQSAELFGAFMVPAAPPMQTPPVSSAKDSTDIPF